MTWTIRWPAGTGVLPTASTGAATRLPSAPCVQTSVPTWIAVTTTSPAGVAICVAAERQIGQLGREPCDLDATDTVPSPATVPLTRARPQIRSLRTGLRLCGIDDEPT